MIPYKKIPMPVLANLFRLKKTILVPTLAKVLRLKKTNLGGPVEVNKPTQGCTNTGQYKASKTVEVKKPSKGCANPGGNPGAKPGGNPGSNPGQYKTVEIDKPTQGFQGLQLFHGYQV